MKKLIIAATMVAACFAAQAKDIVDTAVSAGNFNTLATALKAANLVDTLKGKGPFTVFAPTDEAFAKIPKADLEALLTHQSEIKSTKFELK
jgi:uncharacterized surface protein with fasciclin (FAS1) repeats